MHIDGLHYKEVGDIAAVEDCVELCQNETRHQCRSINYGKQGNCMLSVENHLTAPDVYQASQLYSYCFVDVDDCTLVSCLNGGQCVDDLMMNYTCICRPGFMGHHCEIDIDDCMSRPCENGGSCVDGVNKFTCLCTPGFMGLHCHISSFCWPGKVLGLKGGWTVSNVLTLEGCVRMCHEQDSLCNSVNFGIGMDNNGICTLNNNTHLHLPDLYHNSQIHQYCVVGAVCWEDASISSQVGKTVLLNNTLYEEVAWNSTVNTTTAMTYDNFEFRSWCISLCLEEASFPCRSVEMTEDRCEMSRVNHLSSSVKKSIETSIYADYCIVDINECLLNPCMNGGECVDEFHSFRCVCAPGYAGNRCAKNYGGLINDATMLKQPRGETETEEEGAGGADSTLSGCFLMV